MLPAGLRHLLLLAPCHFDEQDSTVTDCPESGVHLSHGRYITIQLAEVGIAKRLFAEIRRGINRLRPTLLPPRRAVIPKHPDAPVAQARAARPNYALTARKITAPGASSPNQPDKVRKLLWTVRDRGRD
jgi:hypothetical protein